MAGSGVIDKDGIQHSLGRLIRAGWLRAWHASARRNFCSVPAPLDYVPAVYPSHPSLVRLLDGNPEYVPDVCDKLFSDKGGMDQEELLLRFFELFRSEDEAAMFGLVRENLPPTDGKMGLPDYLAHVCFAYQMPFVDVAVLFGSYVLYCAEQKGLVSSTQKGVDQPLVEYRLGEMPQRLESRL